MRRFGMVLVVVALVAGACSDDPATEPTATTQPTTTTTFGGTTTSQASATTSGEADLLPTGGTVRYLWGPTARMNPFLGGHPDFENNDADALVPLVLGGVWKWNGSVGEIEPDLVTEFPTTGNGGLVVNPDGTLTVRYEIDPAAVWSDGVPISGDDFAFTYETVMETERVLEEAAAAETPITYPVCGIEHEVTLIDVDGAGVYRSIVPGSLVAGPKSFEYRLEDAGAYSEDLFKWIIPRHAVEGSDFFEDWNDRFWPSAGPFVLESVDYDARVAVFTRNENYWRTHPETGQPLPLLDTVILDSLNEEILSRIPEPYPWDDDGDPGTEPVLVDGLAEYMEIDQRCQSLGTQILGIDEESDRGTELIFAGFDAFGDAEDDMFFEGLHLDVPVFNQLEKADRFSEAGIELQAGRGPLWESLAFHFGDVRLRANEDSLVEHLDFRRAIAYAIDRVRITEAAVGDASLLIDSVLESTNPSATVDGWERYEHDPDRARELLAGLCDRLGRDCEAEPPTLVFSYAPFPHRIAIAEELAGMLGAVGIDFEAVEIDLAKMLDGCVGWEMSTWTWLGNVGFAPFAGIYQVANPAIPTQSLDSETNLYAWGTGPIEEAEDIPDTDCDESVGWVQGPSSAQNEFTERYAEVFAETRDLNPVIDLDAYLQRILELEDILADQLVFIPLFSRPFSFAARTDIIGGYDNPFVFGSVTWHWNIEEWYLKQPQPGT